jgi:uncharacterized membrane protein YqhA
MMLFFALLVALVLLLVIPLVAGASVALVSYGVGNLRELEEWDRLLEALTAGRVLAAVLTAAAVLMLEATGVVWWGGRALDRIEPLDAK